MWLYPQTEVFVDLHRARTRDDGDLRYGITETAVHDVADCPRVSYRDAEGALHEITADLVVGADGSHSICRDLVPEHQRYHREYPFAWFGILCEAPKSAPELIYARSDRGFALISQRTETVQRMYFQCDPAEDTAAWSDDRIWSELQARLAGPDGFTLKEGPVIERTVLPFRSFVQTPLSAAAGSCSRATPPTPCRRRAPRGSTSRSPTLGCWPRSWSGRWPRGTSASCRTTTDRALARVWKAQQFSYWMTTMLHRADGSHRLRRAAAAQRARRPGRLAGRVHLPRGGIHGMAERRDRYRPADGAGDAGGDLGGDRPDRRGVRRPGSRSSSRGSTTRRTGRACSGTRPRHSSRPTRRASSCGHRASASATSTPSRPT